MKTRLLPWDDINTGERQWGVQVLVDGVWYNCCEGRTPLIYKTLQETNAKRAELRKKR